MLRLEAVTISRGSQHILSDINLDLKPGQTGTLSGPIGVGKTTLLRALAGLTPITAGSISLNGVVFNQTAPNGRPYMRPPHVRKTALAPQSIDLISHKTLAANIALALINWPQNAYRLPTPQTQEHRLQQLLRAFRLEPLKNRLPSGLSGGQQRLACIARAVACAPDLLLLDEAYSNLSASTRRQLPELIRKLLPDHTAILICTHEIPEALEWSDQIGILSDTSLLCWQSPADLWHRPASEKIARTAELGTAVDVTIHKTPSGGLVAATALGQFTVPARLTPSLSAGQQYRLLLRPGDLKVYREDSTQPLAVSARILKTVPRQGRLWALVQPHRSKLHVWAELGAELDASYPEIQLCLQPLYPVFWKSSDSSLSQGESA
ncbi:MAG: ABC transporter ATP-binding protein [Gammaproteobacteria bacterium]